MCYRTDVELPKEIKDPKFMAKLAKNVKEGKAIKKKLEKGDKKITKAEKKKLRSYYKIKDFYSMFHSILFLNFIFQSLRKQ